MFLAKINLENRYGIDSNKTNRKMNICIILIVFVRVLRDYKIQIFMYFLIYVCSCVNLFKMYRSPPALKLT